MPKGYAEAASALLNAFKEVCDWEDGKHASHMEVKEFDHGGTMVRGLATTEDIKAGATIMTFPQRLRVTSEDMTADRFNGLKIDPYDYNRNALWLAEKRAELTHGGTTNPKAGRLLDKYWNSWLRELPTPEDYKEDGLPLSAPPEELKAFEKLPEVGEISRWVLGKRDQLKTALDYYNAHRGDHPELSMEDAIWGQTVVITRSFLCDGTTMAPVGDMLSHSENGNIEFKCTQDGLLTFQSTEDIKAGQELTTSYHSKQEAKDMLMQYGMFDGAVVPKWSAEDCAELHNAHLPSNAGPTTRLVNRLIDVSCPSPPTPATSAVDEAAETAPPTRASPSAAAAPAVEVGMAGVGTQDGSGAAVASEAAGSALKAAEIATATAGPAWLLPGLGEGAAGLFAMLGNCRGRQRKSEMIRTVRSYNRFVPATFRCAPGDFI